MSDKETSGNEVPAGRGGVYSRLTAFVVLSAVFLGLSLLTPAREWFRMDKMQDLSRALGAGGPAAILLVGLLSPLLFLPRWPIAFVCGLLYGVGWGSLLANTASLLGAALQFRLARSLLAPASARLLRKHNMENLKIPCDKAFPALFFLRAFPLSNFVATNLLAGTVRIRTRTYLSATFLGMIPSTLMYAAWGKLLKKPSASFYLLAAVTLAFIVVGTILAKKRFLPWLKGLRNTVDRGNDATL